jgi:putative acetyltransferase
VSASVVSGCGASPVLQPVEHALDARDAPRFVWQQRLKTGKLDIGKPEVVVGQIEKIETRDSLPNDVASIEKLYRDAFPDEDLLPLVRELQREGPSVVSLVGIAEKALVGHVVFTTCSIVGRSDKVALLGPLAVAPAWQRQGIGSAIVRVGLRRLENADTSQVYVLGDPAYYRRFGFEPDDRVTPPYHLPEEWRGAWQSLTLCGDKPPLYGKLSVPQPWRKQALWAP